MKQSSSLCICRSTKGYVAQLMRLYVCTPEGPVTVTLDPHIQPSAPPCPVFSLGTENPVELPAGSVWVVRMPYPFMYISTSISNFPLTVIRVCNSVKNICLRPMVKSRWFFFFKNRQRDLTILECKAILSIVYSGITFCTQIIFMYGFITSKSNLSWFTY